jgi:hypothetical protein
VDSSWKTAALLRPVPLCTSRQSILYQGRKKKQKHHIIQFRLRLTIKLGGCALRNSWLLKKMHLLLSRPHGLIFPGFAQDQQHPCEAFGSSLLSLMGNPVQSTASLPELMGSNYPRTHSFKPARRGQTRHFAPPVFRNY